MRGGDVRGGDVRARGGVRVRVEDALGVEDAVAWCARGDGSCSRDDAVDDDAGKRGGGGDARVVHRALSSVSLSESSSEASATARERKVWRRVFDAGSAGVGRYADSEDSECDVVVGEDADEAELTRELMRVLARGEFGADDPQDVSGDWSFDKVEFDRESLRDVVDVVAAYVERRERREPPRDARDDMEANEVLMQQFNYLSLCADADYVDENREVIVGELLPLLDNAAEKWRRLARGADVVSKKAMDLKEKFVRLLDDMSDTRGDAS